MNVMYLRLTLGGDPVGGWLVDIHDGGEASVHRPSGDDIQSAACNAIAERFGMEPAGNSAEVVDLRAQIADLQAKVRAAEDAAKADADALEAKIAAEQEAAKAAAAELDDAKAQISVLQSENSVLASQIEAARRPPSADQAADSKATAAATEA